MKIKFHWKYLNLSWHSHLNWEKKIEDEWKENIAIERERDTHTDTHTETETETETEIDREIEIVKIDLRRGFNIQCSN